MAVNIIPGDGVVAVGFGQQVAGGVINVFGHCAVSSGFQAVADAIVHIAAGSLAGQAVDGVERNVRIIYKIMIIMQK